MAWDKNLPSGSKKLNLGDDDIRANMDHLEDALGRELDFPGTYGTSGRVYIGVGTTAQRDAITWPTKTGYAPRWYNTDWNGIEARINGTWTALAVQGIGTTTERDAVSNPGTEMRWLNTTTGRWQRWNGSSWADEFDDSNLIDFTQLQSNVNVPGGTTIVNGTTNKGGGTNVEATVTPPAGFQAFVEFYWHVSCTISRSGPSGNGQNIYSIQASGALSTLYPAGSFYSNIADNGLDNQFNGGGSRIVGPITGGSALTLSLQHDGNGSGTTRQTNGNPDGQRGFCTHIGARVIRLG